MNRYTEYLIKKQVVNKQDLNRILLCYSNNVRLAVHDRNVIQTIRREFIESQLEFDRLKLKLFHYGNEGGWARNKLGELNRMLFSHKVPTNNEKWLGVEIECIFPSRSLLDKFISYCKANGLRNNVTIKNDGSIDTRDSQDEDVYCDECESEECEHLEHSSRVPKEIVVTFPSNDRGILMKACQGLSESKAWVNKSCGLHVHFDMRGVSTRLYNIYANRIAKVVPLLRKMLPLSRRDNRYCSQDISQRSNDRYSFVNRCARRKHNTLEIRGHSGTTDFNKINNWIDLMYCIMRTSGVDYNELTFAEMLCQVGVSNELYDYCINRARKFSPEIFPVVQASNIETKDLESSEVA